MTLPEDEVEAKDSSSPKPAAFRQVINLQQIDCKSAAAADDLSPSSHMKASQLSRHSNVSSNRFTDFKPAPAAASSLRGELTVRQASDQETCLKLVSSSGYIPMHQQVS